jgi:hypothetical protein
MITDREFDDIIRSWLEPGSTVLSDRVRDAVVARSTTTPQRRAMRPAWRSHDMSTSFKALAIAAAIVVAVFGVGIPLQMAMVGPGASASPSIVVTESERSASPEPSPRKYEWPRSLAAGTYSTRLMWNAPVRFTFSVPEGWESRDVEVVKHEGSPDALGVMFVPVGNVYADPCGHLLADPPIGPSVVDLTAALSHLPGIHRREGPTPVAFAGHQGEYLVFGVSEDAGCPGSSFRLWDAIEESVRPDAGSHAGTQFWSERPQHRVWVLDVEGERLLIDASSGSEASQADLAELQSVVDSIRIERTTDDSSLGACTVVLTDPAHPGAPLEAPYSVAMGGTRFELKAPYPVDETTDEPLTPKPPLAQIDWTGEGWHGGAGISGPNGATGFTTHTGVNGPQGSMVFDVPGTWLVSFDDGPDGSCFRQFTVEVLPPPA